MLKSDPVTTIARLTGTEAAVALYALVSDLGVVVLNGTTSRQHMEQDLGGISNIREWATTHEKQWLQATQGFKKLVET